MLCEALENEGLICWIAPRDVEAGHYATSIVEGIESSKLFVLLFSQNSNESVPVLNELEMAMGSKLLLIPVRIEEVLPSKAMKFYLMATHWIDVLDAKSVDDFKDFVSVVKKNLGKDKNRDTIHAFKSSKRINKKSTYLKNFFLFIALIASIATIVNLFSWNKILKSLTIEKEESIKSSKVEILANKLIAQTKEAQHWKEEYFRLKEKYKEYPQLTVQAEKIQKTQGYEKAVSFYINIKIDEIKKETLNPIYRSADKIKKEISDTITTNLKSTIDVSSKEIEVIDKIIIPTDKYHKKALIIGNYDYLKIPKLEDPSSSLDKLKITLEELGFDVTTKKNLKSKELHEVIEKFSEELSEEPNSIVFIYFSGHGSQVENKNYFIPININIQNKLNIKYKAINLNQILETLSLSNKLNMFFFDMCIKGYIPPIPSNTLLMYANSSIDNTNFINSLTNQISKPINIGLIIKNIRKEVSRITHNEQIPISVSNYILPITLNKKNNTIHKIFNLSNKKKLSIVVTNGITNQEKRIFCKGEILKIEIKDIENIDYLVVLSVNNEGKVCLLQPDEKNIIDSNFLIQAEVAPPYGKDYLKFFALTSKSQYNEVLKLSKHFSKDGILNNIAIENLYQILVSDKNFREQEVQIQTIPMDKKKCYESVF